MDANDDRRITWDEYVAQLHVPEGTNRKVLLKAAEFHRPHSRDSKIFKEFFRPSRQTTEFDINKRK